MLRGDFHMHTWHSQDCSTSPRSLVKRAVEVGLSCIAVTDHNEVVGAFEHPGSAFRFGEVAPPYLSPAPTLGQHNCDVYAGELGITKSDLARLRRLGVI